MKIVIEDVDEIRYEIDDIEQSDKVKTLKQKVENKCDVHTNRQKLLYRGRELENEKTLQEESVTEGSIIFLIVTIAATISLTIEVPKDNSTFEINNLLAVHTVGDIKIKIKDKTKIPENEQILTYNEEELNKDQKTIHDANISDKAVIQLTQPDYDRFEVLVMDINDRQFKIANLKANDKVLLLKEKIYEELGIDRTNSHADRKILLEGKDISRNHDVKMLQELNIVEGTTVHLVARFSGGEETFVIDELHIKSISGTSIQRSDKLIQVL